MKSKLKVDKKKKKTKLYSGITTKIIMVLPSEIIQKEKIFLKVLNYKPRILYPAKIWFRNGVKIKTFSCKRTKNLSPTELF